MSISVNANNLFTGTTAQVTRLQNQSFFTGEEGRRVLEKVKAFAIGVIQGIGIALFIVAVFFLAGLGFSAGTEKAGDLFSRVFGK